jgi:hypothetical protein
MTTKQTWTNADGLTLGGGPRTAETAAGEKAIDREVNLAKEPGIAHQIARMGRGSNYVYTNNDAVGAVPTVVIPGAAGDLIEVSAVGRITTPAGSGLILSVWSAGGKAYRDITTGVTGLQSVVGFVTVPAANTASLRTTVYFTVREEDVDENGMIVLRLFGANTAAGPQTYTFVNSSSGGQPFKLFAVNLRKNRPEKAAWSVFYPSGKAGTNLAFSTPGNFATVTPVDATGASDIILSATPLDVLRVDVHLRYVAVTGIRWVLAVIKNGTWFRNAHADITTQNSDAGIGDTATGTQTVDLSSIFQLRDTDLTSDGTVTLRLYSTATSGTGVQNHTINGSDALGGFSHMRVRNYGSAFRYVLTPTYNWESGPTTAAGSQQECGPWQDRTGRWNTIYTSTPADQLGWAWTDNIESGIWTKYPLPVVGKGVAGVPGNANRGSVLYENGLVYIYSRGYTGGGIGCVFGPDPSKLSGAQVVFSTGQATGFTTLENSKVIKGHDGAYWLWFDGLSGGRWNMGLAKGPTPLGPFTFVAGPILTALATANTMTGSMDVAFTGSMYVMILHSCPNQPNNVPNPLYVLESPDGLDTWRFRGIGADGTPNSILQPLYDIAHAQCADPSFIVDPSGQVRIFFTAQQNTPIPEKGGIATLDPYAWPVLCGA